MDKPADNRQEEEPKTQLVAVYGTLKHGHGNHRFLTRCKLKAVERSAGWTMYPVYEGPNGEPLGYPICIPDRFDKSIVIEIYEVDGNVMEALDVLEGYPRFYKRELIVTTVGEAWIYYQDEAPATKRITNGEW